MSVNRGRDCVIMFYVSAEEKLKIRAIAEASDMSLSDYARKVLLGKIPNRWMPETVRKDDLL